MSQLRRQIDGYLAVRRSPGFRLTRPEKLLTQFAGYLERAGAVTVTTELIGQDREGALANRSF
jgi:hypothetical protein